MDEIIFLETDIETREDTLQLGPIKEMIAIFGNTMDTKPIQVLVRNFNPYFYVQTSGKISASSLLEFLRKKLGANTCVGVEEVQRQNIYGYSETKEPFHKIYFNSRKQFKGAKALFDRPIMLDERTHHFKTFECNIPPVMRFMNDLALSGMCYLKVERYTVVSASPFVISTEPEFIKQLPLEGIYDNLLPLKILSFDIEACSETNGFPDAKKDPLIQIGNSVRRHGCSEIERTIFCLGDTADIPNSHVFSFQTEHDLLKAWREYFMRQNPDIVIGYNIKSFDFPYILDRAAAVGLKEFGRLGRTETVSKVFDRQQSSNMFGSFDAKEIILEGRLIFDLLHVIRRDHKLRSYSLNSVSVEFLGDQKEDVPPSEMYGLQHGNRETRARIASYCLHDTYLPLQIFEKLNVLINYTELARATHVPINFFSTRGAAVKVLSQIFREANKAGYLIPDLEINGDSDAYEGGYVMEPIKGFFADPIAVLDFTSLYPSIIIGKNLCYTTMLTREQYEKYGGIKTPTGNYFCSPETKDGLLPVVLRNLLKARRETKALLKQTDDPILKKSLDARQGALKVCANSLYGFTGSKVGRLPCIEVSQSTTAFGRDMILMTKMLVENNFNKQNGYSHDSQVIYGDTDSVMVNFSEGNLEKVFEMAKEVSRFVTSKFEKPVSLEFEKVYNPYLLINKKRYAGLVYTNPYKHDKIDTKGIETVRRDNCGLVKTVIETCLRKILLEKDLASAQQYVKDVIRDLYIDQIDLSQLVISKTFTKNNYTTRQAHTELAKRLKVRGVEVGIGDRIPYVIVKGSKNMAAYEKSEDPVYVLENNLPIDKEYYIEQQLQKPVERLFEPVMGDVSSLFHGEHTKIISRGVTMQGPMNMFVKATDECIGCKKAGTILCEMCRPNFPELYLPLQDQFNEKAKKFNSCWTECQRCMGSMVNEVLCINRVCPIFYMRTKVKKELEPLEEKLMKLRNFTW